MTTHWINAKGDDPFFKHTLSKLLHSHLDSEDPTPAIRTTLDIAHLLLLSNHLSLAHSLISSLYLHGPLILSKDPKNQQNSPLNHYPLTLSNFYLTFKNTYALPAHLKELNDQRKCIHKCTSETEHLAHAQWGKYRECTRTGWMLDHYQLPEPSDPHNIWKTTDEPRKLAICARLLAKNKDQGEYASEENLKEAVQVAQKLYSQPQILVTEWNFAKARKEGRERHSALLYRRLIIGAAIKIGDLETAAKVLGLGLRLDGFCNGFEIEDILMLPGIYDILPLLAAMGREGNPFFVEKSDAEVMVRELDKTTKMRVEGGRQWALAPEKVGWEELLMRLARGAWRVNKREYKELGVKSFEGILFDPATEEEIEDAERKCGALPGDFKDMVRVSNGCVTYLLHEERRGEEGYVRLTRKQVHGRLPPLRRRSSRSR